MDVNADVCRKLNNYLCEIIGSEDVVKVRRQYYVSLDYFCERETAFITSGSRSEGLDMGSDLDIMGLLTFIHISQKRSADSFLIPNNFTMETESCKPGFTQLKGHSCYYHPLVHMMCAPISEEYVFASGDVRLWILSIVNLLIKSMATLHGPCISDGVEDGTVDFALCLRCPEWIKQAQPWLKRERYWPSPKLVSIICEYGILLVPIGCKESPNEHLEWRISFSVAEKHLIFSFTHTQLLCYALMKLLLKEVINKRYSLKGFICSYFLKTIIFWVSEEFDPSMWRPENIWLCFMKCFKRLIYCVTYELLPHFFITENNRCVFEQNFNQDQHLKLVNCLAELYSKGLGCFRNSKTLSHFYSGFFVYTNKSKIERICCEINTVSTTLNTSAQLRFLGMLSFLPVKVMNHNLYDASCQFYGRHIIRRFLDIKSDRFLPSIVFCRFCQIFGKTFDIHVDFPNRYKYSLSKRYLPYFYLGVHADAVSGWLYLATYFYGFCQYKIALQLILHASVNCSDNKLFLNSIKLYSSNRDDIEKEGIFSGVWNRLNVYRRHVIDEISFYLNSKVNPQELKVQNTTQSYICPNVYLYFLRFLCLYRLNESSIHHTSTQALLDIRAACQDEHFNSNDYSIADTSECLAVALSICGCQEQAKIVFSYIKKLNKTLKHFTFDPKLLFFLFDKLHKLTGIEIFYNESMFI
ncbi:uncharacterized protein LOC127720702 [Mytilus californianus]|uniref:uncharacterized protein LOC127720702 n=1 Tax=Mytilus californianus TaxID=6549 RepID=UPI00224667AD|nr:uncharacterized protein LOC127720702 [Mytilus californianus]XP_052083417.1 uncharacterized protein LOC127720702 [Mytilus californianus]